VALKPGANHLDVEDGARGGADGVLEGLQRGGAVVEGEAAEGDGCATRGLGAAAGRVATVGGGPFGVGDVELVGSCRVVLETGSRYGERVAYVDIWASFKTKWLTFAHLEDVPLRRRRKAESKMWDVRLFKGKARVLPREGKF